MSLFFRPIGWTAQDEADADSLSVDLVDQLEELVRRGFTLLECIEVVRMGPAYPDPVMRAISLLVAIKAIKWLRRRFAIAVARK